SRKQGSSGSAMRRLRRLACLSASERQLLIHAALLVPSIRLGLWLLPFRTVRALLAGAKGRGPARDGEKQVLIDQIAWSVRIASRWVPAATCLTQALAVHTS